MIEQFEDTFGTRHGGLKDGVARTQVADGDKELFDVGDEGNEGTEGNIGVEGFDSRVPEDRSDADAGDHFDGGIQRSFQGDGAKVGISVGEVDVIEFNGIFFFAAEALHDGDALDLFVEKGVEASEFGSDASISGACFSSYDFDENADEGHESEGYEGHAPIEGEHEDDDTEEAKHIAEGIEGTRSEKFADGIGIIGHACDKPSDGASIEKLEALCMKEFEDTASQIMHGASANDLHGVHLREGEDLFSDDDDEE